LFERATVELDVQALGVAAHDLGRERAPVVGQVGQEGLPQPFQIARGEALSSSPGQSA
jgi:hypothetical protein